MGQTDANVPLMAGTGKELRHDPAHQRAAALAKHAQSGTTALRQAVQLQQALHEVGLLLTEDIKASANKGDRAKAASALAGVSKGWQSMSDQARILRGEPLPGSLRPSGPPNRSKREPASPVPESPIP